MDRKTFRSHFNFEVMAKLFFDMAEERYPSAEKMKQLTGQLMAPLNLSELEAVYIKIAVLNAKRDMVKEVSPGQLYRSLQHRDDLYTAIIEALEDLEDELEEIEENGSSDEEADI